VDELNAAQKRSLENEEIFAAELSADEAAAVEAELRHCLAHVPAPEGFTDRVMARVSAKAVVRKQAQRRALFAKAPQPAAWWMAIAAMLLLAVGGDVAYLHHERQQREAAVQQDAEQQMDRAFQLTNHALDQVQGGIDRTQAGKFTEIAERIGK
jgi:hypothetical protein